MRASLRLTAPPAAAASWRTRATSAATSCSRTRLAPVVAVGGEGDVAGAVDEAVGHGHPGPAGEGRVAGPQSLLRGGRRGRHDGGRAAEAQEHDRAVRRGERPERPVRQAAQQMEVAEERQAARRRRRKPSGSLRTGRPLGAE